MLGMTNLLEFPRNEKALGISIEMARFSNFPEMTDPLELRAGKIRAGWLCTFMRPARRGRHRKQRRAARYHSFSTQSCRAGGRNHCCRIFKFPGLKKSTHGQAT